jgi:hypothetical protein
MKLYEYENYDHYVKAQSDGNKKKIRNVYVEQRVIDLIASTHGDSKSVLCHGTRNGAELKMFQKKYPNAEVMGTEISDTAEQFENTVQWDFTHQKEEWVGHWDVIYTNSFDHSMDPEATLGTWRDQLSAEGRLYLDYDFASKHNTSREMDPLEVSKEEIRGLFRTVGLEVVSETNFSRGKIVDGIIFQLKNGLQ